MPVRGLKQVAQRATDLDASVAFYEGELGLRLLGRFEPPGLAMLDLGDGVRLLLEGAASSATIYLAVDDLDATCERLSGQGVTIESMPHLVHRDTEGTFGPAGGEEWMAFLRDPAGNLVGLMERR
jgi:methylmalonyl-CoA/ethylmalonyl-CoA epimerase